MLKLRCSVVLVSLLAGGGSHAGEFKVDFVRIEDRKAVLATVEPVKMLVARARIGGTLVTLKAHEGANAEAGEPLAVIADEKLALQIRGLDSRIQSQDAQREKAVLDFNRIDELFRRGAASQSQVDQAKTALDMATRQRAALDADRDVIVQQAAEGTVLAPGAGRILSVPVAEGMVVMPGEVVATLAEDRYILRMELPERHARFMRPGDKVTIGARGEAEALMALEPGEGRIGKVLIVYPEIKGGRVVADVAVDGLGDYFVGERTRVLVPTGMRDTLMVPRAALIRRAGIDFVRLADGRELVVKTGESRDDSVEILSGLVSGDVVVTP